MRARILFSIALGLILSAAGCGEESESPHIRLATTTSTYDSGLLEFLLPPFEASAGVKVDTVAVGTGRALALGRNGDADIILVHARAREDEFVAQGFGIDRRDIMWNDFLIAGPPEDPAGVGGLTDAAEALRRIAAAEAVFISRGDDSGTHTMEKSIWKAAGLTPEWPEYKEAGQGMGACLTIANEMRGYLLADRGTFLAFAGKVDLAVLVEGDPVLRNPYGAILVNPEKHPGANTEGARKLLEYLTSAEGQKRIGEFRVGGGVLFHPHSEN